MATLTRAPPNISMRGHLLLPFRNFGLSILRDASWMLRVTREHLVRWEYASTNFIRVRSNHCDPWTEPFAVNIAAQRKHLGKGRIFDETGWQKNYGSLFVIAIFY